MTSKIISRILFYGLFLVGPWCLTEAHSHYVRSTRTRSASVTLHEHDEEWEKTILLDRIGMSAFTVWSLWLMIALGFKIYDVFKRKGKDHNHQ